MDKKIVFEARNLEYSFEGLSSPVLRNINFSIYSGETIAIVGPNGTGKSTLINLMLGYLKDYRGSLKFFDEEISGWDAEKLAAVRGFIPQENEADLRMSVIDYLRLSKADPARMTSAEIVSILSGMGIAQFADRSISSLSGGESRMVQLAFTLSRKPEVLLLDEPISFLDVSNQKKFFDMIKSDSAQSGTTVVAILHDLNAAAYYADRIMLVCNGEVVKFGTPNEVVNYKTLGSVFFTGGPESPEPAVSKNTGLRAHVVCGGGSGAEIIKTLISCGFTVTAGVLNAGDSDWNLCLKSGIKMAEEEPFKGITEENYNKNVSFIRESDVIAVCEFPLGAGNLKNLRFIEEKGLCDGKTILSGLSGKSGFDYTGGLCAPLVDAINERSLRFSDSSEFRTAIDEIVKSRTGSHL